MPGPAKLFLTIGAITMLAAVALGAFGAHALKSQIAPELIAVYRTGVEYHFTHALGLLVVGLAAQRLRDSNWLRASGWLLLAGIVIFSGSLYLLALTGVRALGAVPCQGRARPFGPLRALRAFARACSRTSLPLLCVAHASMHLVGRSQRHAKRLHRAPAGLQSP